MSIIAHLFFASSLVCVSEVSFRMPSDVQDDDSAVAVKLEDFSSVIYPASEGKASLQKRVEEAKAEVEAQIKRLEGGIGSYYEYYSAVGNVLCLQFALNRAEYPQPKLTQRQVLLAEDIKDNFQKRIRFLANAHSAGIVSEVELINLKINALLFERKVLLLSSSVPNAVVSVQEKIVNETQALLDVRRKQEGLTTGEELMAAERLFAREKDRLAKMKS